MPTGAENFYALDKRASRPPWKVRNGFTLVTGKGERYVAQFDTSESARWAREDVRLAAHCRNNFGMALAALKRAIKSCNSLNEERFLTGILLDLETVKEET